MDRAEENFPRRLGKAFGLGIAVGALGLLGMLTLLASPSIDPDCTTNSSTYTCRFFNKGNAAGGKCVRVVLMRNKEADNYVTAKEPDYEIRSRRICSGRLEPGQDSAIDGKGFFTKSGEPAVGEAMCRTKADPNFISGCSIRVVVSAETE